MKDEGNLYGPTCHEVCSEALCNTGSYHTCDNSIVVPKDLDSFNPIANGLGFTCQKGGCWNGVSPAEGTVQVHLFLTLGESVRANRGI